MDSFYLYTGNIYMIHSRNIDRSYFRELSQIPLLRQRGIIIFSIHVSKLQNILNPEKYQALRILDSIQWIKDDKTLG